MPGSSKLSFSFRFPHQKKNCAFFFSPMTASCPLHNSPPLDSVLSNKIPQGRAMAQAVSRRPLTTEARVRSQIKSIWDLWWTKWHWDRFFSELSVFPCRFHSTGAPLIVKIGKTTAHLHHRVAQEVLRLWCVRSICCGALHHAKKKSRHLHCWNFRR
jgi:hypothetical protein